MTLSQSGNKLDFEFPTDTPFNHQVCLKCMNNDLTPSAVYSIAFNLKVLKLDCSTYITVKDIPDFVKNVPGVPLIPEMQLLFKVEDYLQSKDTFKCPIVNIQLM